MNKTPPGFEYLYESARMAKAYHALSPYPKYGFKNWKTETRGPIPKCAPIVRRIVKQGASWLFGKPLSFSTDEPGKRNELDEWINEAWSANYMTARSVAMAETGATSGAVVLKGSWDEESVKSGKSKHPFRINVLDAVENCRLFYDQHDQSKLVLGRVQYPVRDENGKWFLYREDWTDDTFTEYDWLPLESALTIDQAMEFMPKSDYDGNWHVKSETPNLFKVIPMVQVKNIELGYWHGCGDLWSLFPAIDTLNLTYDLASKDNQTSVYPRKIYIDVKDEADDQPMEHGPGASEHLVSDGPSPDVKLLESSGKIRDHLMSFAEEWKAQILECAGSVDLRPETITNKGNMTSQVMAEIREPLIQATEAKRQSYGENGIAKFMETMLLAFANSKNYTKGKGADVSVVWPPFFEPSEEELSTKTTRLQTAIGAGFTTQERAAQSLALDEGCTDVEELLEELKTAKAEQESKEAETLQAETESQIAVKKAAVKK